MRKTLIVQEREKARKVRYLDNLSRGVLGKGYIKSFGKVNGQKQISHKILKKDLINKELEGGRR